MDERGAMTQPYQSFLASGIVAVGAAVAVTMGCNAAAAHSSGWRPLGDASLQIRFAPAWSMEKDVRFESEGYTVTEGRERLLRLYLGNNPDLKSIAHDAIQSRRLNGNDAREYYARGVLAAIVVTPRCGHDKYVWMTKLSKSPQFAIDVDAAMRSLRCGTAPRS
jgi:putative component of toxin-antitoxin plasmid stabilization module